MTPFRDPPPARPDPRLARALWQCLGLGLLLCLFLPPLRGQHLWLGWMPFWLVIAPALGLLSAYRHRLLPASRRPREALPRRRRWRESQAQRLPVRTRSPRWSPQAA